MFHKKSLLVLVVFLCIVIIVIFNLATISMNKRNITASHSVVDDTNTDPDKEQIIRRVIDATITTVTEDNQCIIELDLNQDKQIDYQLLLRGDHGQALNPVRVEEEKLAYTYMSVYTYRYDLSNNYGEIELTMHHVYDSGLIYYVAYKPYSQESNAIIFQLEADGCVELQVLKGVYEGKKLLLNHETIHEDTALPNTVNYIDGDGNHIRLGRVFLEKPLGRTVVSVQKMTQGIQLMLGDKTLYQYRLPVKEGYATKVEGMVALEDLVGDKDNKLNLDTLSVMDLANEKFMWADGVYYENPDNYEPRADNDFYRTPSALHMRACYWVMDEGSIFKTYGISLMYTYMERFNNKHYIPTEPKSEWLYDDYGIEDNFYDTRFNTDTISGLLHMQKIYPDDQVKGVIDKYFAFFMDYVKDHGFYVDGHLFVADYMNENGEYTVKPHCSLNHMLEEMTVLYRYHLLYENQEAFDLAEEFLTSIMKTKDRWIRPHGDLYYCVTEDGRFIKDDYPLVTYNDLNRGKYYLEKVYGEVPRDYMALLESKERWAKDNGYIKE